jgi:hypothetical protein
MDSVPAIHLAPDGASLVVDTKFKKAWVHGIEITGLQPDSHAFRFIEVMARNPSRFSCDQMSATLSPGRQDGTTPARQAKNQAKKIIIEAMAAAGRSLDDDPFPSAGPGHYRCALPPYIR